MFPITRGPLPERFRLAARSVAKSACAGVPDAWLLRLRSSYHERRWNGFVRSGQRAVLGLVRLRGIPLDEPFRVPGRPAVRMVPSDSYIAHHLFWLGLDAYEPGGPDWWARLVATHRSVLEVGANIGLYTVIGGGAAPTPYRAVEPNPLSCAALRRNVTLNGLAHVEVSEAAVVGERSVGEVTLRFPDRDPYGASAGAFVAGATDLGTVATRGIAVPAVALDDLVAGVDLLKLDIEGLELDVLSAVRPWLARTAPTLLVEVLAGATGLQRFLADLVAEVGYRCVAVSNGVPGEIPAAVVADGSLQRRFGTRDVTLLHPVRARDLGLDDGPWPGAAL